MGRILSSLLAASALAATIPASAQLTPPRSPNGVFAAGSGEAVHRTGRPVEAFKGCEAPKKIADKLASPGERMATRDSSMTDPTTARVFAAIPLDDGAAAPGKLARDCRYRLDGVWRQDVLVAFDNSKTTNTFGALPGGTMNPQLTHGSYTTPVLMYVSMSDDGQSLSIRPATTGQDPIVLYSHDGVAMADVMVPAGATKTYSYPGNDSALMQVSVSRTGKTRLRWAGKNFVRPEPTVTESRDLKIDDAFLREANLDSFRASLRGYDIVDQDPFYLNGNMRANIFAKADPRDYAIVEKRTVPLGLKLIQENIQGMVTSKTLISSQSQYQKTSASTFGYNIGFTAKDGDTGETLGSLAAGARNAQSSTIGRQFGLQRSVALGFARHKLYTLVLDRPFVKLTDDFIDAVDYAYRNGEYDDLIDKFGTHYPYAVTYGSQARMWASFDQKTVARWKSGSQQVNANAGLAIGGFEIGVESSRYVEQGRSSSQLKESSEAGFEAVGGTGSYSQEGHATGTPVPILADLRPISDLLNPLYFPGEPEIYHEARQRLEAAIARRLAANANRTGLASVRPVATPARTSRPRPGLVRNITVVTRNGSRENIRVTFGSRTFKPGAVRICMQNFTGGERTLYHGIGGVNPMKAGPGGSSCATVSSRAKMTLSARTGADPATIQPPRVFDLSLYDNGYVNFDWGH